MFSFTNTTMQTKRDWIDLVTEMLWVIERETKFTLKAVNEDFKQSGLSFDMEFRNHFLQIIYNRVAKTYDQFQMNLEFEELRNDLESSEVDRMIEHQFLPDRPCLAQKRKISCDLNANNQTFLVKRPKADEGMMMIEEYNSQSEDENKPEAYDESIVLIDDDDADFIAAQTALETTSDQVKKATPEKPKVTTVMEKITEAPSKSKKAPDANNIPGATPKTSTRKNTQRETPAKITNEVKNSFQAKLLRPAPASVKKSRMMELDKTETKSELNATKSAETRDDNTSNATPNGKASERPPSKKLRRQSNKKVMIHKCDKCIYKTGTSSHFKRHMMAHLNRPFCCQRCTKKFTEQDLLDMHMKIHENQCIKCHKRYKEKSALEEHDKRCNWKQYECYLCRYHNYRKYQLVSHMANKHTGVRPFKCKHCSYASATKPCLIAHQKVKHK
ncbi:zinc finger protein 567-like [Contarinia nasturtii]|uniref:zinc finger protein 567-like n=1 Tax=Contarinia nasturtii TaxID=265458 RepID=UPI0012D42696|nr:zinc finger protein 567-like [Contarinia nasturtii]